MARRFVVDPGLPWPAYAWPLTDVPVEALETLTLRAVRTKELWSNSSLEEHVNIGGPTGGLQLPSGSVVWISIVRGRWCAVASRDGTLRIWDMEDLSAGHAFRFDGISGRVTSDRVDNETLVLNTE